MPSLTPGGDSTGTGPTATPGLDTVNLESEREDKPIVKRDLSADPSFATNEVNLWTNIKGAAGKFIREIAVPTGVATVMQLFNPDTKKMASTMVQPDTTTTVNSMLSDTGLSGWSRIVLDNLPEGTKARLSEALGGPITQLSRLVVNARPIASVAKVAAAASVMASTRGVVTYAADNTLSSNIQGFTMDTIEESENVVGRPTQTQSTVIPSGSGSSDFYYYDSAGKKVTIEKDASRALSVIHYGHTSTNWDIANAIQPSFIQEANYIGEFPTTM